MQKRTHRIAVILALLVIFTQASGQKLVNSPYSRFNLGILEPSLSFRSAGMGGLAVALRDNSSVSYSNPASYSSLDTNSFLFDVGLDYTAAFLKDNVSKHFSDDMNFDHLVIAFPIMKNLGFAAGVTPYSNGYYFISRNIAEGDPEYNPIAGEVTIAHKGSGGITRAFAGTGITLLPGLSAGANINILFGSINRINETSLSSDPNFFNSRLEENITLNGFGYSGGLQYVVKLRNKKSFTAGVSYQFSNKYKSDYNNVFFRYTSYNLPPYSPDTLYKTDITGGTIRLPQTLNAGISFNIEEKLTAGVEYNVTNWSEATLMGTQALAPKVESFRVGIEYIPDRYSIYSPLERMEYRLGGYVSDNYLMIGDEQIKEFGITFGIGMLMARSWSKLNLYFDYNSRGGSLNNGLHRENCFSLGLSLNLYDYWFIKAKYD